MSIEIADLILLLAAAQGFFLCLLIFHKHGKLFANRFLGSLILVYSLILLHLLLGEQKYFEFYPHITFFLIGLGFLGPPLHYLYAKYLVKNATRIKKSDWLHFLPFILYEIYWLPILFQTKEKLVTSYFQHENIGLSLSFILYNWAINIQAISYMILTLYILKRHKQNIRNIFSSIDKIKLDWLRNITLMAMGFITVFFIENLCMLIGLNLSNFFNLTSILAAVYVYVLGYLGLFKVEIFTIPEIATSMNHLSELNIQNQTVKNNDISSLKGLKYQKSGLSEQRAEQLLKALLKLMEEKAPYTNSNLTLNQLSEMLEISPHNLSEIINIKLQQNFFDFINHYRIEKVKRELIDPQKNHLTILGIAYNAGFNSKSSFNAIFRKHMHMTPSVYRHQHTPP